MSTQTLVSVIVPCYNQGRYLSDALDSLISQTYPFWECIIVNDGSKDATENIARNYCKKDSRIKYIYQENSGVISARNQAIKVSSGEIILPLDADDWIAPTYIEKATKILESEPLCKIVYGKCWCKGDIDEPFVLPQYSLNQILADNCIPNCAFYRRKDYDLAGGYNPNMKNGWEDYDFWLSILESEAGGYAYMIDEVLFFYRILHLSRTTMANQHEDELRLQIIDNHKKLYADNYKKLYYNYHEIVSSRMYKVLSKIVGLVNKAKYMMHIAL